MALLPVSLTPRFSEVDQRSETYFNRFNGFTKIAPSLIAPILPIIPIEDFSAK